ncbi:MAG TPA: sugar phosphate isomerase/epimerase family protein [Fimbriimonadaceae bacterium]|nr:sugar phosphate isomerase/epimerase family protein [Fimbriimonadaceae bacterium]
MSTYLTGFGDEISGDLDVQLRTMKRLDVEALDLRTAFGKNVLQLSDEEIDRVAEAAKAHGLRIQSVSSPVNKVRYSPAGAGEELKKLERAAQIANRLGIRRIRIFSPETDPEGGDAAWPEVKAWMADQVALAKEKDVLLMHENDGRFFGAFPANARRLLEAFHGEHFRAIFDFGNSVLIGCRTMRDWFPWLLPYLDTLHIKDASISQERFVASGEGDGEMVEAFRFLFGLGWAGPLTLEPHAQVAGPQGGFSGEEAFEHAVAALRNVLAEARNG